MESKSTDELNHEIKAATDIEDYLKHNRKNMVTCSLPQFLNLQLTQKGIKKAAVVHGSLLNRAYVYQIFSGEKTPSRDKLIALAFGLKLSAEETQTMLKISENGELYAKNPRDAIILFALCRRMSIFKVNELLFDHDFPVLGAPGK